MKLRRQRYAVLAPTMGLRTDVPSTMLDPRQASGCEDISFSAAVVRKAPGTTVFGNTVASPLDATVMAVSYVAAQLLFHTTASIYIYDPTDGSIDEISDITYTGSQSNPISSAFTRDLYVWTNGVNEIRAWPLTGAPAPLVGASEYIPVWLAFYGERLCLYGGSTHGTPTLRNVTWSATSAITNWTGTGWGFNALDGLLSPNSNLLRAERLGDYMIIYADRDIVVQEYNGDVNNPFSFTTAVTGCGLAAPRALVNVDGREHIFLGQDDIYVYRGSREVEAVGEPIREELFSEVAPDYIQRSFMAYRRDRHIIRLHIPTVGHTSPNRYYEYNTITGAWSRGSRSYSCFGSFRAYAADAIDSWTMAIDDMAFAIDDTATQANALSYLYGTSGGSLHEDSDSVFSLSGAAFSSSFDTKDFTHGEGYLGETTAWMHLRFEARGSALTISQSTDGGVVWSAISSVTLTDDWTLYELDFETYSPRVRFRFAESSTGWWEMRYYEVGYIPSTDRGL